MCSGIDDGYSDGVKSNILTQQFFGVFIFIREFNLFCERSLETIKKDKTLVK